MVKFAPYNLIKTHNKTYESIFLIQLTVGTYSEGNLLVVYEISKHVLPTAPSPTTTHLMVCMAKKTNFVSVLNHNVSYDFVLIVSKCHKHLFSFLFQYVMFFTHSRLSGILMITKVYLDVKLKIDHKVLSKTPFLPKYCSVWFKKCNAVLPLSTLVTHS